ncbi:MAG: tRNA preQ1(34) S-adenosylmethionine ribosyltransferase-isomerase QueA [Acidimicrobiales bacterium]|nr:tRNA preQ1(34) S-adenosylmethionine ribosyltransferase-isomerase QueA [Hyphomonadaceae bacterium]RZV41316.1 MAG: tRNA preQ1(34) S-adenosylmethionine ribosyltransferase-isomerase QueA [Acidimicrobiales bacterium]
MDVELFNFDLPDERIALRPAVPRDSARLLLVDQGGLSDHTVRDLPDLLREGDILVLNETKVLRASLSATRPARAHGGGGGVKVQINLHKFVSQDEWRAFVRPAKRLRDGDEIHFSPELSAEVYDKVTGGDVGLRFNQSGDDLVQSIKTLGEMPLPPYIARQRAVDERDNSDYQTVFAKDDGSVAAPTAGLHFTPELIDKLAKKGIEIARLTLHVGAGTFLPISHDDTNDHEMHAEWYSISEDAADKINLTRKRGGRVVAVGTTALRALESNADKNGLISAENADTSIFITPGYHFRTVDGLLTNFHLPKSTLFMLVCALAGYETMKTAYKYAVGNDYRFYSYGDTSLLWTADT